MSALASAVRTTGINWESVAAVAACVAVMVTVVLWLFARVDRRRQAASDKRDAEFTRANAELKNEFTQAINHLSDVLTAKLETKEAVAQISVRLARLEGAAGASGVNDTQR